ncbi:TlpA family protein disulfide reductase [Spongiactinospora gelatinilytica]|uniref:TlpA family protein disulfide reductase n=1 Tax=Spongiactinospora gelatinilytica TaxID=2666298 RepID=UPI0011B94384|nr:redoxin domain-containing protein [Spongiactinospora gelatinilytica]
MPYLVAGLLIVGALCLFDLILTVGVIKRLREHTERLALLSSERTLLQASIGVGEQVDEFAASTTNGTWLNSETISGEMIVAFFSSDCVPCKEKLPKFAEYVAGHPGSPQNVLSVVAGEPSVASVMAGQLSPLSHVVVEDIGGSLSSVFKIKAFPAILRIVRDESGKLVVTDTDIELDRASSVL